MNPLLTSTRLDLRPVQIEDVELVHEIWTNSDVRHFLFDDRVIALDEARSLVEQSVRSFEERGYGIWLVFSREAETRMKTLLLLLLFALITVPAQQQTMKIKLYFPNTKRDKADCSVPVYPTTRTIAKTSAVAKASLEQLFAGPTSEEQAKGFYSDFSDATKSLLISVNIKDRNAYVNLRDLTGTSSIGNFTTSCGGSNFFGQVENTLKQFPTVRKVFFAIEGDPSLFYDWMQIGECPKELKNCDASNFIK